MHPLEITKNAIPYYRDFVLKPSIEWLPVFFRTLSALVIAPVVFFTMLDVTAYLIGRTIGVQTPHASRTPVTPTIPLPPKLEPESNAKPTIIISASEPDAVSLSSNPPSPTSQIPFPQHFVSSENINANLALAGDGLFSPPESRASTPPPVSKGRYHSRKRAASVGVEALGMITDDDGDDDSTTTEGSARMIEVGQVVDGRVPGSMRKRNPGLQITPMGS